MSVICGPPHERGVTSLVSELAGADDHTWAHSLDVAACATRVGQHLGLSAAEIDEVCVAALLHDVGKVRLPPYILSKPGALTPEEWRLVRRHPEWGAELVVKIPGLEAAANVVLLHHERPDGLGYPFGLRGEEIPVASRIVSACDAFEAITSGRPYRAPLDPASAIRELRSAAGTQFDPDVIEALAADSAPRQLAA